MRLDIGRRLPTIIKNPRLPFEFLLFRCSCNGVASDFLGNTKANWDEKVIRQASGRTLVFSEQRLY